jgi:hypothetical protein
MMNLDELEPTAADLTEEVEVEADFDSWMDAMLRPDPDQEW